MAYVNFSELQNGPSGTSTVRANAPVTPRTAFSALEWQVVALARGDELSSLSTPNRLITALEAVFGFKRRNPELANPALEALRRMSVMVWHFGSALPQSQIKAFYDAGYSEDQFETLLGSIGAGRLARKRKAFA